MYIADLHCDSLSRVNADNGLINKYNMSREYPALQLFAEFVPRGNEQPSARRRRLMHYLDVFISEERRLGLVPVTSCHDLNFAVECDKRSAILSLEGGGGLFAESEELGTLYRAGLRVMGLAWDSNELAACSGEVDDYGLTAEGAKMVERCSELGIVLDISHLSDRAARQLMELTAYPVIATHSNLRDVCGVSRNLPLDIARSVARRGGVIGLNLCPSFLNESGKADASDIFRQVDYALEQLGENALAFGLDIDGISSYPQGFDEKGSIHDRLIELLLSRYSESVVERIAGLNAIEFFKNNL